MQPLTINHSQSLDARIGLIEAQARTVACLLENRIGVADSIDPSENSHLDSLNNLIELHAAATGCRFVDRDFGAQILQAIDIRTTPCVLNDYQLQTLTNLVQRLPSNFTLLPLEVLAHRVTGCRGNGNTEFEETPFDRHSLPVRDTQVAIPRYSLLPEDLRAKDVVTIVESWFERVHQTLNFACLEIARFSSSQATAADVEILKAIQSAREMRDHLMALTDYSIETSRKVFWQGALERGEYYAGVKPSGSKTELYYHHDNFRLGRIQKAREEFKSISEALFELCECYVTGAVPRHPISVTEYGMGGAIPADKASSGMLPIIIMEAISDRVEEAFSKFKYEALRTRSEEGRIIGASRCANTLQYVNPNTLERSQEVECRIYRGPLSDQLLRDCVELANQSVHSDPLDPALRQGGLTVAVELEKLAALISARDVRLSTIHLSGKIAAFELVILGREIFSASDFEHYIDEHPFHAKKSGYLKLAVAGNDILKEFVARKIRESPFDILHRRMTSELQARNEGISASPYRTRYLLTQIRVEPVENRASVNAAMRNYGIKTGIVTSSTEDDGIERKLEFYLIPLSFSGFFNTHLNY